MGMQEDAVKRNMNLSEEDRAKNLLWAVVGRKGEKRLVRRLPEREIDREDTGDNPVPVSRLVQQELNRVLSM
jgi:hypothetical protein